MSTFNISDETYSRYSEEYQAKMPGGRIFYHVAYLIPSVAAYALVNIEPVHKALSSALGLSGYSFQYAMFIAFTLCWHLAVPILMLRWHEKLKWAEVFRFLSLNRFSFKEVLVVAPVAFALSGDPVASVHADTL